MSDLPFRRHFATVTILAVAICLCFVVTAPARAAIPVVADYSSYRLAPDHELCLVELCYSLSRDSLAFQYLKDRDTWQAQFRVRVEIRDTLGNLVDSMGLLIGTEVATEAESKMRDVKIIDVLRLYLPPAEYVSTLTIADLVGGKKGSRTDRFVVRDMNRTGSLNLSDLQFAHQIRTSGFDLKADNVKVKNGYFVEPNPSAMYAPEDGVLYFYAELYNLQASLPTYSVHMWILDRFGDVIVDVEAVANEAHGESALLTYGIGIADLKLGERYILALEIEQGDQVVTARDSFWLGTGAVIVQKGPQETFTEEIAELYEHVISHIAMATEVKEYKVLSLVGKQRFLEDFWLRRDPTPETPDPGDNEFRKLHIYRFTLANELYSRSMISQDDGWSTDRGRVSILYGQPSDIIRSASSIGTWGWERWEYHQLEGGVFFIFLDWKNLGDYRLMHSSKQGERYDPDWQLKVESEGLDIITR